jgi:hypothetical protein
MRHFSGARKGFTMKQTLASSSLTYLHGSAKDARLSITIHEHKERVAELFAKNIVCDLRAEIFYETINGVNVPAVATMVRLDAGRRLLLYHEWIDDLAPNCKGVLRALASQAVIGIRAATPRGRVFASATIANSLSEMFADGLSIVHRLKKRTPWTEHHFAAARAFVESQYPTPLDLWQRLEAPPKTV